MWATRGEYESTRNLQLSCEKNPPLYNDTTRIKNCQVVIPNTTKNKIQEANRITFKRYGLLPERIDWYFKRSGNGNSQGPTIYSDIEDLIESQPVDKTMQDWEQSTIEAEHIIKPLTVEGQTNRIARSRVSRKFIGIEIEEDHYSRAAQRLSKFTDRLSVGHK